jgi:2-methylcitrate dehydratase PrpD
MGLTAELGAFIASLDGAAIPEEGVRAVRRGIADCIGVAFAGAAEAVATHAVAFVSAGAEGEARIWTTGLRARSGDAAFVNATIGHALDFDDTGLDGHPSVVLGPVVLAEAERLGLTWRDTVTAYVAGYETWAELIGRDADKHHGKGWHPTAVFGAVAGAAASARLRGLTAQQAGHALGIAASMAGGLVANFGSHTKPLQVGFAARNGIAAAELAERGVTATHDALESPRGFLAAISPAGKVRLDGAVRAGVEWQVVEQGLNVKRYPACYGAHRIIDAALALREAHAIDPAQVEEIVARVGRHQAAMLRSSRPQAPLDAKFSAEYVIACALARGHVDLADFDERAVLRDDVQQLLRRVRVEAVDEPDALEPLFSVEDRLSVRMKNGDRFEAEPVRRALGHASRPIGEAELRAKFMACAAVALDERKAQAWWEAAMAPLDSRVAWPG